MNVVSIKEKKRIAKEILSNLDEIGKYQLTIELAEKLDILMNSEKLKELNLSKNDPIDIRLNKSRKSIIRQLAQDIDFAQSQTEDIEELKKLKSKLTKKLTPYNQIFVGAVIGRIENKILKIQQQKAKDKIKNDISANIENIISEISKGILDIQNAKKIIDEETKKRVENKPKTKFTLTQEQEKKKILNQITTVLIAKAEQYHIENPETTIMQLQELSGGEIQQSINTVVENLINTKKFEKAKEVCNTVYSKYKSQNSIYPYIKILRKKIKNAEISDMVLKGINMHGTEKEENAYFELIEKGLEMNNVNLNEISLGKSQDGLRTITLADIWINENKKEKLL